MASQVSTDDALRWHGADGRLDRQQRVTLPAASRTPGRTGFSLFRDDVQVSLQDLVVAVRILAENIPA